MSKRSVSHPSKTCDCDIQASLHHRRLFLPNHTRDDVSMVTVYWYLREENSIHNKANNTLL